MTAHAGGAAYSSSSAASAATRAELRAHMRRLRRSLSPQTQYRAALSVAHRLLRLALLKPGARIGVYLALPGELNLQPFFDRAWRRGCRLFVPHITHVRRRRMAFYPLTPASQLREGQWNIPQLRDPHRLHYVDSNTLDAVLVPTVAFDRQGHRLGMGGGFYDRHFARRRYAPRWRPHLIGIAYACQEVAALNAQPHDVHLELIVTEHAVIRASRP